MSCFYLKQVIQLQWQWWITSSAVGGVGARILVRGLVVLDRGGSKDGVLPVREWVIFDSIDIFHSIACCHL